MRKASDIGIGWGCELVVHKERHDARLAAPAPDLEACNDIWTRPPLHECTGSVLPIPPTVAARVNAVTPQQSAVDGVKQRYELIVKLWSRWEDADHNGGSELPVQVFEPREPDPDMDAEGEESPHPDEVADESEEGSSDEPLGYA